jgi:hypothetical protein
MTYKPRRGLVMPTLWASLITGGLTSIAFSTQTYIGSPYGSTLMLRSLDRSAILMLAILFLSGALFAFVAVWPLAFLAADWALGREVAYPRLHKLHWPATGALLGIPALLLYSFPLHLGQSLWGQLAANGAVIGLICASLTRSFLRKHVVDAAVAPHHE